MEKHSSAETRSRSCPRLWNLTQYKTTVPTSQTQNPKQRQTLTLSPHTHTHTQNISLNTPPKNTFHTPSPHHTHHYFHYLKITKLNPSSYLTLTLTHYPSLPSLFSLLPLFIYIFLLCSCPP